MLHTFTGSTDIIKTNAFCVDVKVREQKVVPGPFGQHGEVLTLSVERF
jgi:hypothetical protein